MASLGLTRSGFTLIEMMLVVLIISILAGSLAANLQGRKDSQALRVGAEDLAAAVRFAAAQAATQGRCVQVALLHEGRAFEVQALDEKGVAQPLAGLTGSHREFARQVHVDRVERNDQARTDGPVDAIAFGGGRDFAGWIELVDGLGQSRRIEVADATAQVRIVD